MYFCNKYSEEFSKALAFLNMPQTVVESPTEASEIHIDLEEFIFKGIKGANFAKHNFKPAELISRFNSLMKLLQTAKPEAKTYLYVNLVDVKSNVDEDLFKWSYYSHKFASSKGKDIEAMNLWHEYESKIGVDRVAEFKARREANMELYLDIVRDHLFFERVYFAEINPILRRAEEFGMDISEEQYLRKLIVENDATSICKIVPHATASSLLHFIRQLLPEGAKQSVHIVTNSESAFYRQTSSLILHSLNCKLTALKDADFVLLINEQNLLTEIPFVDSNSPIMVVDLSKPSSPSFAYLLLKDEGFEQVCSYAKLREQESKASAIVRAICAGVLSLIKSEPFTEQIVANYLQDYFTPLAVSMSKTLEDFRAPIELLQQKVKGVLKNEVLKQHPPYK